MSDLVERARIYATRAHERINHRRKYSDQPYAGHLEAVARRVAAVTDDEEMIAAAWLHDTVEDTPATLEDIEEEFGKTVADLVEELTDISRPGDGNRAKRKEMDRIHLAQASVRAKSVKLSDLIDNCRDITKHDPRFARVYLNEMKALLEVLKEGDSRLLTRANRVHRQSIEKLGLAPPDPVFTMAEVRAQTPMSGLSSPQFRRMFSEIFTARDIAEPLLSFDINQSCEDVASAMDAHKQVIASVRLRGEVQGYVRRPDLGSDTCTDIIRHFTIDQVVSGDTELSDVIHVLTRHDYCFVSILGEINGVIDRDDINKPTVRMWLFGIITMVESGLMQMIEQFYPDESWTSLVSPGRLIKAKEIQEERMRRNLNCGLIHCLQLSDKGQILINEQQALDTLGFESKREAKRAVKKLESLRNHLAHAQDIVTHDWAQIARLTQRMDEITRLHEL